MALTDAKIRNLKPGAKPYKTSDYDGLYVLTNPGGSKLWRFKYRIHGKEKLLSIGPYPSVELSEARSARDEARKLVAQGIDPSSHKQEQAAQEKIADGSTFFKVKDQGQGIPVEEQKHLFTENGQISTKPTDNEKSTGLGLVIVKKYVEAMKGEVWYEGQSGGGSTFVLRLPSSDK